MSDKKTPEQIIKDKWKMAVALEVQSKAIIQQVLGMAEAFGFDAERVNSIIGNNFFKDKQ